MSGFITEGKMADSADNIQTYRQMLKLDGRSRVFALLAEELCAAGQWEEAADVCKKGLLCNPDHLRSRVLLGWALMELGDAGQSERILLNVVEDIRKSTIIFKLLSEFATVSGNTQSASEYARIYEVFQTPASDFDHVEPACSPIKEVSEWDKFKAEAIEELQGAESSPEISAQLAQHTGIDQEKTGIDEVMMHLSQRIEGRVIKMPAPILSEDDKSMLKEKIVALLGAGLPESGQQRVKSEAKSEQRRVKSEE
jgi:tetratricopeptide (TPR) repeat protein